MMRIKYNKLLSLLLIGICISSCKKFVVVDAPNGQLASSTVYTDDVTATAAVLNMYGKLMSDSWLIGSGGITIYPGLSADEFVNYFTSGTQWDEFFTNSLTALNYVNGFYLWRDAYSQIYSANSVIEGLENSTNVSAGVKSQLAGEAKFMRAFLHFYLVNLFGDVPLATTTNYKVNAVMARTPASQVYERIIQDLVDAEQLLNAGYVNTDNSNTTDRVRPTKYAARALLARAYLYTGQWAKAEEQSTAVIDNAPTFELETDLDKIFLKNSKEAIWQLMPVSQSYSTYEGHYLVLTGVPTHAALDTNLVKVFEINDQRKTKWVGSFTFNTTTFYFPHKYKVRETSSPNVHTEYYMVFRLAEQYLIRSEARAQLNNVAGAQADLNSIRNRSGLANTSATNKADLLTAIEHEKRIEFFAEWGHRWFDLKRWDRADAVLAPAKGSSWQSTDVLYPIPIEQINANPNCSQNPGY